MNQETMFCKYHPVTNASHYCQSCHICLCDHCINENKNRSHGNCYLCNDELIKLEEKNNILPFWRRLQESFWYPMNANTIILIVGLAFLSTILNYIPGIFAILWSLLLTSALFKYSFSCLNNTSHGDLDAPDITEAYGGGFGLVFQLIFLVVAVFLVFWLSNYLMGSMIASLVGVLLISAFPAIMINFGLSENIFAALNPQSIIRLISSVGLPYGLLLGFVLIMIASVSIINELIGNNFSLLSTVLQSSVSNYYTIVVFHIMGYMIYQYHSELGFEITNLSHDRSNHKSVLERNMANIDILLKEGDADAAIHIFTETIESYPAEKDLKHQYFELLLATNNSEYLTEFASEYMKFLKQENRTDQVPLTLKRIFKVNAQYKPNTAEQRHEIATLCHHKGDASSVIKLINGLHKDFPDYHDLVQAYTLMAESLEQLPNMANHAKACRNLIIRLGKKLLPNT